MIKYSFHHPSILQSLTIILLANQFEVNHNTLIWPSLRSCYDCTVHVSDSPIPFLLSPPLRKFRHTHKIHDEYNAILYNMYNGIFSGIEFSFFVPSLSAVRTTWGLISRTVQRTTLSTIKHFLGKVLTILASNKPFPFVSAKT